MYTSKFDEGSVILIKPLCKKTDRTAAHKTALGQGMPNLAAYTQSGAIPTLP